MKIDSISYIMNMYLKKLEDANEMDFLNYPKKYDKKTFSV
jgi:hypothetical protein